MVDKYVPKMADAKYRSIKDQNSVSEHMRMVVDPNAKYRSIKDQNKNAQIH